MKTKQAKEVLARMLREQAMSHLISLGFQAWRPKSRRVGMFPTYYQRLRGDQVDSVRFDWDLYGRPLIVVRFAKTRNPKLAEAAEMGARIDEIHGFIPDLGGELAARRYLLCPRWFGLGSVLTFILPEWVASRYLNWKVGRMLIRLNELDALLTSGRSRETISLWWVDGVPTEKSGSFEPRNLE
ncbi:MAG: hypothetical protein R3D67_22320 [Hyphomicrobiaceae bacterium]